MRFQEIKMKRTILILLVMLAVSVAVFGQRQKKDNQDYRSTVVYDLENQEMAVAARNNLYCAGYIQRTSFNTKFEIVGANEEKDKNIYAEGDELYINAGAADGVKVGDMYSVIRPRGKFKSKFSQKGNLGVYVQELGAVEVMKVMREVSVAKVKTSCGVILFGDLVTPVPNRESPMFKKRPALDLYADPSGKVSGRIVMARDGQELVAREQIVYIDLGREDNVRIGDYMTIYRPLGSGNIYPDMFRNMADNQKDEYESDRYQGGEYSNQAPRKKGASGTGRLTNSEDAKARRPGGLRRIVGELIVLNVFEKTATAMIVRTASEIHTGDHVELQ